MWIEIIELAQKFVPIIGRSPRGECGLKLQRREAVGSADRSLPSRGVWIEMELNSTIIYAAFGRSPRGECGLK